MTLVVYFNIQAGEQRGFWIRLDKQASRWADMEIDTYIRRQINKENGRYRDTMIGRYKDKQIDRLKARSEDAQI